MILSAYSMVTLRVKKYLTNSSPVEWWLLFTGIVGAWLNAEGNIAGQMFWLSGNVPAAFFYWRRNHALSILFGYYTLTCIKALIHAGKISI